MFDTFSKFSLWALNIRIEFSTMKIMDIGSSYESRYESTDIDIDPKDSAWNLGFHHPDAAVPSVFSETVLEKIFKDGQKNGCFDGYVYR